MKSILSYFDIISVARDYNREKFSKDLGAGLTVGIIALPQALAFAILG